MKLCSYLLPSSAPAFYFVDHPSFPLFHAYTQWLMTIRWCSSFTPVAMIKQPNRKQLRRGRALFGLQSQVMFHSFRSAEKETKCFTFTLKSRKRTSEWILACSFSPYTQLASFTLTQLGFSLENSAAHSGLGYRQDHKPV